MKWRNVTFSSSLLISVVATMICCSLAAAQSPANVSTPPPVVPRLVQFNGTLKVVGTRAVNTITGVTFALYKDENGGAPLWLETQNVQPDSAGRYKVMLGSTTAQGLPAELFVSGEARWIGVQVAGQPEQPRVLLLSVPYALKAGDAETIGGLPPSAFMLAAPTGANTAAASSAASGGVTTSASAPPPASSNVTTTGGTASTIPMFTAAANIQNSILTQTGASAINVGGKLNLPSTGAATATAGRNSRAELFVASAFSSTSALAVPQTFQLQAEGAGNNSATPSGTLNLLYGTGTTAPRETGFKIGSTGILSFVTGQTFPGTGKGTITGVTAGTDLLGGGTNGVVTLNLDTTKIPLLAGANNFTSPQDFKANVGVGITPSGTGYTPLSVGGTTSFGTWLALANTSTGGHTWNIISAGSRNAEGAGNLGITDLTGTSTIWLEGNTKTTNLTASGTVGAAALVVTNTAGSAIIDADGFGANAGGPTPGLRFGGGASGEGIASNRTIGLTKFGLDFYTEFVSRMSIHQNGQVGIGTASPAGQLGVVASSNAYPAIYAEATDAASNSGQDGGGGINAYGSNGDGSGIGGEGVTGFGGSGGVFGGDGGDFYAGYSTQSLANSGDGIYAVSADPTGDFLPLAGFFEGNIQVDGTIDSSEAVIRIDHPLDPANKYLTHSSVESPDMKNIYDGVAMLDASGEAVIQMPEWFSALNRDFRYQLTCIGGFAPVFIAEEIAGNQFKIGGGHAGMKVSWQVTGIRQDAWANAHRKPVEQAKSARERGFYLAPEVFGAPREKAVAWARHPQVMKQQKEHRLKAEQTAKLAVVAK